MILGLDTATAATAVAVLPDARAPVELRHDPAPGERPGHAAELLPLARRALEAAGATFADVRRIGVGVGPGTFTGLRIGVATARALAQATGAELVAVSTLEALAEAAGSEGPVLAVIDARRGEAFAAGYRAGERLAGPVAVGPDELAALADPGHGSWLAVGDGAVRFRDRLEPAVDVPADASTLHRASALAVCRLARTAPSVDRDALLPQYVRAPDAVPRR
ncbi:MAG TPA: tRNA (adenosine(37)-N6)-threonylcarbamoyltransferase complex dimerization subunit type 1 TsaB [Solirubrobacteraceae bacterium]